jgi:hypothetical protein
VRAPRDDSFNAEERCEKVDVKEVGSTSHGDRQSASVTILQVPVVAPAGPKHVAGNLQSGNLAETALSELSSHGAPSSMNAVHTPTRPLASYCRQVVP